MDLIRRRCPPKRNNKHYDEMNNRAQTSRSVPLNKCGNVLLVARKEVRDFVTRPELFSLLMWLPSLVVSSLLSPVPSVGQRTFSPAAFQRAGLLRISSRQPSPRRSIDPTDERRRCRDLFYVSEANGPTSPFPQYARKIREAGASRAGEKAASWISRINRKSSSCASCSLTRVLFRELLFYLDLYLRRLERMS